MVCEFTAAQGLAVGFDLRDVQPLVGVFPGLVIDALSGATQAMVGGQMPAQTAQPWLSIVPIAESRSSYNGLLVFVFIAASTLIAIEIIHRLASRGLRRGPAGILTRYEDGGPRVEIVREVPRECEGFHPSSVELSARFAHDAEDVSRHRTIPLREAD